MSNIRVIQVIVILLVIFGKPFVSFGYFSDITKSFNFKYYYDNVGSTIALTNDTEQVIERIEYAPFSTQTSRTRTEGHAGAFHDTPFLWTGFFGNQTDSNNLTYLRARYYNTLIRSFVNSDPARDGSNWYAYAGGNPMSFVDPTGLGLNAALNAVQTSLSFLGLIPVIENAFDVVNAGISVGRGNLGSAAFDLAAAIPGFGQAVTGTKLAAAGIGVVATTGRVTNRGGDTVTVFRGVREGHPGFKNATQGLAKPRRPITGHSNPARHNAGDTRSKFVSITTDRSISTRFSGSNGVVIKAQVPKSQLVPSPDIHNEAEFLLRGNLQGIPTKP